METVLIRKGNDVFEIRIDDLGKDTFWGLSKNAAEYAIFSALVYQEVKDNASIARDLYPDSVLDDVLSKWQFIVADSFPSKILSKASDRKLVSGLKYHCWYSSVDDEFLVVFRGTSNYRGDLWTNFRWVTRFVPGFDDHYNVVQQGMQDMVDRIQGLYGVNTKITVSGHSLGGGLAQQAAYAASGIENVYVFNSSPVTGFYEVEKSIRKNNSMGLKIVRIFEQGEILSFLRSPLRLIYWLSQKDPEIHEMRFNLLTRRNLISEHSILEFSKFLYKQMNTSDTGAPKKAEQP